MDAPGEGGRAVVGGGGGLSPLPTHHNPAQRSHSLPRAAPPVNPHHLVRIHPARDKLPSISI